MKTTNQDKATARPSKIDTLIGHLKIKAEISFKKLEKSWALDMTAVDLAEEIKAEHAALVRCEKALRRVLNDITAQGNVEAKVGSQTEIELTNAILAVDELRSAARVANRCPSSTITASPV